MLQEKAALHAERKTHGVDLDGVRFQRMVDAERAEVTRLARERRDPKKKRQDARLDEPSVSSEERVSSSDAKRVAVHVRVRPLSSAERLARAVDVVTCVADGAGASSALVAVHEPRTKVDCTRHVESSLFEFDGAFDARASNADVYAVAIEPLVRLCVEGARVKRAGAGGAFGGDDGLFSANATVFAYGQTGSGKTHTMTSLYEDVARDVCLGARDRNLRVEVSFYEVYAGKCFDLLAERKRVKALEDARGRVRVVGLTERVVREPHEVLALAEEGAACRKTSRTDANASSSRSHSVFQIALKPDAAYETAYESREDESLGARLSLVDLAGSERGADRGKAVSESVRREGAEINTSLLALKECIRALSVEKIAYAAEPAGCTPNDAEKARVPFRGSKLTTVLRDAFVGKRSRTVLLAHISPGHDAAEHTVNTLRYATRLKEMGGDGPREKGEKRAFPEKIPPLRERDANATEKSDAAFSLRPTRAALAEKRRVAFESGRTLLDAHRMLARASEAEAEALESAERALAAVERDAAGGGEGDKDESAARRAARDEFHAACDALAATLERRAALEQSARRAAANARAARAEEQAAVDAADVR